MSDDFLAREAAILGDEFSAPSGAGGAGGDIDFDRAASAFPDLDSFDADAPVAAPPAVHAPSGLLDGFDEDDFGAPTSGGHDVKVTGDDEVEKFESEFPDIQPTEFSQPPAQTYQPSFIAQPQSRPSFQPPTYELPNEEDEPEVIRQWRIKQEESIRARDEESKAKRQATIAAAERAIDEFYEEYGKRNERTIQQNKDAEAEYLAEMEAALGQGTTWSRIADLIELQNSQSKTIARSGPGTTDLTRYKEVLLRLKREGESAPGAAGY